MYRGMASMEKTTDHCNISVNELDCNLVLVLHCKHGEERKSEREKDRKTKRQSERKRQRQTRTEREKERKR